MTDDSKLKNLLALVSSTEDEIRAITRTPADHDRSRSKLVSSVETLDRPGGPGPTGRNRRLDELVLDQLTELLGPATARRALEMVAAAVGRPPDALGWDVLDSVTAALRPRLVELLGSELAGSAVERLYLSALAERRS